MEAQVDSGGRIGEAQQAMEATHADAFDDARQVVAARAGDRAAFGQLYERYSRMVHGILLARVPSADVADLVHDVFLLALRRLGTLREPAAFGGWLAQIARNRANDFHRRGPKEFEFAESSCAAAPARGTDREEALAVLAVIRTLPEAYREPLILRLVEGMTGPEISARTGLTPGSVRVNLHRGMQQLREKLGRSTGHE